MRIGELLVQQGVVAPAAIEAGLRTQAQYGGRLASILVDLGYVDADVATRLLSRQRRAPAAVQKHFDAIDRRALSRISAKVADKHRAIPLGFTGEHGTSLIVAMVDPNDLRALEELQFVAGCKVVAGIALELRVRRALSSLYRVGGDARGFVHLGGDRRGAIDAELEIQSSAHVVSPDSAPPSSQRPASSRPKAPDLTLDPPSSASQPAAAPSGSSLVPRTPASASFSAPPPSLPPFAARAPTVAPAARTHAPPLPREEPASSRPPARASAKMPAVLSAGDALVRLRTAASLDERADVLLAYLRSAFAAGVLFVVRNDVAFAWKAFGPNLSTSVPPSIAVPLTQPSLLVLPYEARSAFCGTPTVEGTEIHARIWNLLGTPPPREAVALPLVIDGAVAALVYAQPPQGERLQASVVAELGSVCAAAARR